MNARNTLVAFLLVLCCGTALAASTVLKSVPMPGRHTALQVDPVLRKAFLSNLTTGDIDVIDIDAMAVVAHIPVGPGATRIRIDAAHHRVYVLHATTPGAVTAIDGKSHAVIARTPVGDRPSSISLDPARGEIYTTDYGSNQVSVIDTRTNAVVKVIPLELPLYGTLNTRTGKLYVPLYYARKVAVIDQATRSVVKTFDVGMYPYGAVAEEKDGGVYVIGPNDGASDAERIDIYDAQTYAWRGTLTGMNVTSERATRTWNAPQFSPVYGRAYFSNALTGTVTFADTAGYNTKTLTVGGAPLVSPAINADDGEVYVTDLGTGTSLVIIDARLERVAARVSLGGRPTGVGRAGDRLVIVTHGGGADDAVVFATVQGIQPESVVATDFYHAEFDHYFHTANPVEARVLSDGIFGEDWERTEQYWRVWTKQVPVAGLRYPVCRFFSTQFGVKSSHFYTPYEAECESLKQGTTWQYEETGYYVALPDAKGTCAPGLEELYRLYNQGQGGAPNHAYTASRAKRDALVAKGWASEGTGPQNVFACTPPVKGFVTSPP